MLKKWSVNNNGKLGHVVQIRAGLRVIGKYCRRWFFLARFRQSYASRYSNCSGFKMNWKKENSNTRRDMLFTSPPPPHPPPIISNASPSLKDTIMKDHCKGTHFPDIVTGLTMGSTTFEEVGVWWFRSGQEFFPALRDFFFCCYCKYKTINCNCIFFPPSLFARNVFDHPA